MIAQEIASVINEMISPVAEGLVVRKTWNDFQSPVYINSGKYWAVGGNTSSILKQLNEQELRIVFPEDLSGLMYRANIDIDAIQIPLTHVLLPDIS